MKKLPPKPPLQPLPPNKVWLLLILLTTGAGAFLVGGCELTPQEKRGYSSIPQNQPASWETKPYGNY